MGLGEGWAKGRLGLDGHFKVNFSQFWSMFGQNRTIFDHSDVDVGHFWDWVVI